MKRTRLFLFFWCAAAAGAAAQDLSAMNADELNKAGYRLYEQKQYRAALPYFKAALEKTPEYVYPHYNYACVVSLVLQDGGNGPYSSSDILEHLLITFHLNPSYLSRWRTDPDLMWYREHHARQDGLYDVDASADEPSIRRRLTATTRYYIGSSEGVAPVFASVRFSPQGLVSGILRVMDAENPGRSDQPIRGRYFLHGNLVYITFEEKYPCYGGAWGFMQDLYLVIRPDDIRVLYAGRASVDIFTATLDPNPGA